MDKHQHALQANVHIVEAIHSALFSLYEKVDVDAILARVRCRPSGVAEVEPTDEEFAASCQLIADPIEMGPSCISPSSSCLRSIGVQRLLRILSDRLGCEVRQGKGREIVVFRAGGHHFRLGHHKHNAYVPAMLIKNLLRRVGVSFCEWLAAIT